jgi:hypothetical protein
MFSPYQFLWLVALLVPSPSVFAQPTVEPTSSPTDGGGGSPTAPTNTDAPTSGGVVTGDDKKCLKKLQKKCYCGLFLAGRTACVKKAFKNADRCAGVNKKKVTKDYTAYCTDICRSYVRSRFFTNLRTPVIICANNGRGNPADYDDDVYADWN